MLFKNNGLKTLYIILIIIIIIAIILYYKKLKFDS